MKPFSIILYNDVLSFSVDNVRSNQHSDLPLYLYCRSILTKPLGNGILVA